MIPRTFITGGTGFLGRRVVDALRRQGAELVLLDRSGPLAEAAAVTGPALERVRADLLEPDQYVGPLATAAVVLHMAGRTGRAPARDHYRDNVEGTRALLGACRRAGVRRMLFVSSIAVKFPDQSGYPYARAKCSAEREVRASGMSFTMIRPTIILGEGSPILAALEKLALLPVIPIFGSGRTLVQPIHVDDVADIIVELLARDRFDGETLELGGPAPLSIEELIQHIRRARTGAHGRLFHLPVGPMVALLRAAEASGLARALPVTAGQLASFRFDGTIDANPLHESRRTTLRGIAEMVAGRAAA